MSEQPPLYNTETKGRDQEAALIGAVLRRPAMFVELRETVKPEQFSFFPYRFAWEAISALSANEQGIDVITLGDELDRRNQLTEWCGHESGGTKGRFALARLRDTGQPQNARDYAANVTDYAAKREILNVMSQGASWAANGRKASDILTDLEKRLSVINPGMTASRATVTLKEAIGKAIEHTDKAARGEIQYIKTGYIDLDAMISGFTEPDLTIIAGRPGSGKTALLASLAQNILTQGKKIAFFSLEMGSEQLAMRFISMLSGVPYQVQQKGEMSLGQWEAYNDAVGKLSDGSYGLYLNDLPAITPNRIRQELRRLWPVDLLMVDYLQLAGTDGKYERRDLEVAAIVRAFKGICKEFHIPAVVAAQMSRASEARSQDDKRPIMSDLGESSAIEQTADKVIFIHRPVNSVVRTEIVIAKQRNGPIGLMDLNYFGTKTRFETVATHFESKMEETL